MLEIDHTHFYVDNAKKWRDWFVSVLGFQALGETSDRHIHTEIVAYCSQSLFDSTSIIFLLSSALNNSSPVADYLSYRPCGVVDVAFRVSDLEAILKNLTPLGLPIQEWQSEQGKLRWATITNGVNFQHTLIERQEITPIFPHITTTSILPNYSPRFLGIDHLVLNVGVGELEKTTNWYENILGFEKEQTFTIKTGQSGLYSQVLLHPSTNLKFPLNEPLSANSQIQEFINLNKGSGIQHIALKTPAIIDSVAELRKAGLEFLSVPNEYYNSLDKANLSDLEWQGISKQKILIDADLFDSLQPLLLQIFTKPIFKEPTFFLELIERRNQKQGFGEKNFQALFEAIEEEQAKRGTL